MDDSLEEQLKALGVRKALHYLDRDFDRNAPRLIDWVEKHDRQHVVTNEAESVRRILANPDDNWNRLVHSLWADVDDGVRRRMFETFVVNGRIIGAERQRKARKNTAVTFPGRSCWTPPAPATCTVPVAGRRSTAIT